MRNRTAIESDGSKKEILVLEVLLDIREILKRKNPKKITVAKNKN